MTAAIAVLVSHAYLVTGGAGTPDPLERLTGFDLGFTAVLAFFAISGFFISASFERRASDLGFVIARATRILPALLVVALLSAFAVGPALTDRLLSEYFSDPSVWLYVPRIASFHGIAHANLPGLFAHNPYPNQPNVSLWTLYFEVLCYAGLFVAGLLGWLGKRRFAWLVAAYVPIYLLARYGSPSGYFYATFSLPFVIGMIVYRWRDSGALNGLVAAGLAAMALATSLSGHPVDELWSIAIAYGVLWLGFAKAPLLAGYARVGDFSYGTYIYGFIVQQGLAALLPRMGAVEMIALSLPLTLLCGIASWYLLERPALGVRRLFGRGRTRPLSLFPLSP